MSLEAAPIRVVTAASLFDGHDAAINVMRRILQAQGAELIHLGHDRSVDEIVEAALEEDAHAIAVSSYQGGHMEFFRYLVDRLGERGAEHIRVFGGGGGTITADEIEVLHDYGVARIFSPADGQAMGLDGMIRSILESCERPLVDNAGALIQQLGSDDPIPVARLISCFEEITDDSLKSNLREQLRERRKGAPAPVVGFTGTGGAGKSSVVDEMIRRYRRRFPEQRIAVLCVDPTRRRSGGALLGDRIRMNGIHSSAVYFRSMATRRAHRAVSESVSDAMLVLQAAAFDIILLETAGIGQSDSEVVDLVDLPLYVMTPEYGAPSQLEKIDMIDLAEIIVLNKFDRRGAQDALREVRKQWRRNRAQFQLSDAQVPVFPTIASRWSDPGSDRLFEAICQRLAGGEVGGVEVLQAESQREDDAIIPGRRSRYLAEIADHIRAYHGKIEEASQAAGDVQALRRSAKLMKENAPAELGKLEAVKRAQLDSDLLAALEAWPRTRAQYREASQSYLVRDREVHVENHTATLARTQIPKVATPASNDWAELTRFFGRENLPGSFPFTAGVFPFKRQGEDPARMFAGEGGPERTNRRFHFLARESDAKRLSTAFDSVTLYGRDPAERPDIYGKVGNSGVSICTLDDAKKLYSGFDLSSPQTSVSMTINGPAPMVLAFFLNVAIDQNVERYLSERGELEAVRERFRGRGLPSYHGELPPEHNGLGLGLLGISGSEAVDAETYARICAETLRAVRGTVQADILKEDQAQNTCIFSTEFALRLMGDIQEFFCEHKVKNFYSVSISGYHMAEAGANPISQLAFTLANGFTYLEYYRARGLDVDEFASNFSYFFSNGLDAEYSVIGRVARRIWAIALRDLYAASERSQKLKYHIQTSGRSLHAQEMSFNDIRTTLQALTALQDNCNSLHTNAFDEAVTTPTEGSVRRAVAIQHIINQELGLSQNENPLQGSYLIDELTDLVEEAVLEEFERLSERGGVLGAMELLYQRGRIQDESLHYETLKHSGELPVIGVNTFLNPDPEAAPSTADLMRSSDLEKRAQLDSVREFQQRHASETEAALERLQAAALAGDNAFAVLMETVKSASLGQITEALFEVGGRYRRAM